MTITVVFDPPLPSDAPAVFNSKAFTTLGDLNDWSTEANALASDVTAKQTTASDAATTATTQADIATNQAGLADSSRIAAQDAAAAAAASYDAFDDRNLGAKASDPTQDNDGNALIEGALYWNSTVKEMRTWDGTAWVTTSVANAVSRGGDTMTGPLEVPAAATGLQAVPANETVRLLGGAANLPTWTTAGRPGSPAAGYAGFNTTLGAIEIYNGSAWVQDGWQSSVVSASGSAVDFTGIPSWARQLRIGFIGVSSSANDPFLFQLGGSGGVEGTGYITHTTALGATALSGTALPANGFAFASTVAAGTYHGFIDLILLDPATNTWGGLGNFSRNGTTTANYMVGTKALSAALDRVRVTFAEATTFDAGSISLLWRA